MSVYGPLLLPIPTHGVEIVLQDGQAGLPHRPAGDLRQPPAPLVIFPQCFLLVWPHFKRNSRLTGLSFRANLLFDSPELSANRASVHARAVSPVRTH
jgi:hypothetical protein